MPVADVTGALAGVVVGIDGVGRADLSGGSLFEVPLEKWNAPATPGPGSATFADLARHPRLMDPDMIQDLTFCDMKAVADGIVEFHAINVLWDAI